MNDKSPIPVVCAIIEQDGKFLVAQRNQNQSNAGLWEFPGGKVCDNEDPQVALQREIEEELGIEIEICGRLEPVTYTYPWISIELIPFICRLTRGVPFPLEHSQVDFFDKHEARTLEWAQADLPVLERYLFEDRLKKG